MAAGLLGAFTSGASAGQYAQISDDLELYYEDVGQGEPMVWVPLQLRLSEPPG
jgi:hypothetical protein